MALKSIGIVGCAAIGKAPIGAVAAGKLAVRIADVASRKEKSARDFLATLKNAPLGKLGSESFFLRRSTRAA